MVDVVLNQDTTMLHGSFPRPGLWIGSYGGHGSEFVMIHYSQDRLYATKVTGDVNVPRGEVSFSSSLTPQSRILTNNIDFTNSEEFRGSHVFKAFGIVAMPAFSMSQTISVDRTEF
jgi:hypothetical protein